MANIILIYDYKCAEKRSDWARRRNLQRHRARCHVPYEQPFVVTDVYGPFTEIYSIAKQDDVRLRCRTHETQLQRFSAESIL